MKKILTQIGIVLPIFFFLLMLFTYAVNVPWFDDIDAFPETVVQWIQDDFWEGIKLLFRPNNEHRMLLGRLFAVLCYQFTGELNMRWLILVMNLQLMGILFLFWKVFQRQGLPILYFLPVGLLLLHPQYHLTSLWAITGWQHESVLFWGFLSVYLLTKNTGKSFVWTILTMFITTFSMSNGMFFWMAGLIVLLLQRRHTLLLLWAILMVFFIGLYFYGFDNQANSTGLEYLKKYPHESFFGFFTFLGGSFDFMPQWEILKRSILPTIMGFAVMVFCTFWVWKIAKNYLQKHPVNVQDRDKFFVLGCFIFVILNAGIIALLRPRFGYFVMLVGNYKIYPALLLTLSYLMLLLSFRNKNKQLLNACLIFALIFNGFSYWKFLPEVAERHKKMLVNIYNQQHNGIGLAAEVNSPFALKTVQTLNFLTSRKAYFYPQWTDNQAISTTFNAGLPISEIQIHQQSKQDILIESSNFEVGSGKMDGIYLVLKSITRTYLLFADPKPFLGKNPFVKMKGFSVKIPVKLYQPDRYEIGIYEIKEGRIKVYRTNQEIDINF